MLSCRICLSPPEKFETLCHIHMSEPLTDRLDDERAHQVRSARGQGRMKELHALLWRAGLRASSLTTANIHGLCFWTCAMLDFDERAIAGARAARTVYMRNLLWLMLRESPAVCMQHSVKR
jgi:hypothetical protein